MRNDIINPYTTALPIEAAVPLGANVLLAPILARDFDDPTGITRKVATTKEARTALLFEIIAAGPGSALKDCVGDFVVVAEAALDFADCQGKTVVCEDADIKVRWPRSALAVAG